MKYLLLFLLLSLPSFSQDLHTIAEKSNWTQTGRADEAARLCRDFARKYPEDVQCKIYGETPEGRVLHYLLVGEKKNTPIVWVQAGIHAGEIDGKDAVFWLLKDILEKNIKPDPLKKVTLAFIPIVNLDGHERFGKWNRPNQSGPEEMGWRTTSQNFNMNRDFIKADSKEMKALLKLWLRLDPVVSLDLHATNGAQFRPEVGVIISPTSHHGNSPLHLAGKNLEDKLMSKLKDKGRLALPFYPSFEDELNPLSGFSRYVSIPRFSQGYWFNQNRLGILVETHSWKDYKTRVTAHRDTVWSVLEIAQEDAEEWQKAGKLLDKEKVAGKEVPLEFKHSDKHTLIDFPGYKFSLERSEISGGQYLRYFTDRPETWKVPFHEELLPSLSVRAPELGYFIPKPWIPMVLPKLKVHQIEYRRWRKPIPGGLEVFRAETREFATTSFEGHQMLTVKGQWKKEQRDPGKESLFIPIDQKRSRLVLQLMEPMARDSLVSWGFFNTAFEAKEYMEDYVAEDVAREMLKDSKIKREFEEKLRQDETFAKDPAKRLNFFYLRHPSYDERLNLYPVYRK